MVGKSRRLFIVHQSSLGIFCFAVIANLAVFVFAPREKKPEKIDTSSFTLECPNCKTLNDDNAEFCRKCRLSTKLFSTFEKKNKS